jgi:hypothetical protein
VRNHFAFILLALLGPVALQAEIQFAGFFTTPSRALYSLVDTTDGVSSGWLKVGDTFRGHTVVSFDGSQEILTLKHRDQPVELRLRAAKVQDGKYTISGSISLGVDRRLDGVRATLFLGEEAVFPLGDGMTLGLTAQRMSDGNILYRSRFVVRGQDGKDETIQAPGTVARPGQAFSLRVGELGYAFTP